MTSNKTWRVDVAPRARKFLKRIPFTDNARIVDALDDLAFDPWHGDVKKLTGEDNSWRRRVGNYRISYSVSILDHIVVVEDVDRRTTTTYRHR